MGGVTIKETCRRTGMTVHQVRGLVRRREVRFRRQGKYVVLHPADVETLEANLWEGQPVQK